MPPSSRTPPLLEPHVRLPKDDSILLLTSTLGATANWLIVRFLCDALSSSPSHDAKEDSRKTNVVLVSWMREYEFWKQEARKGGGLDLERLKKEGRFAFVDGLSSLFLAGEEMEKEAEKRLMAVVGPTVGIQFVKASQSTLPVRGPPGRIIPARGPPPATGATTASTSSHTAPSTAQPNASSKPPGLHTLKSADLADLRSTLTTAISSLNPPTPSPATPQTLLILDNPDILLATSPSPSDIASTSITPTSLTSLILTLHTQPTVSHILTHMQSDTPLLSLSTPPQPLEVAQHNFLVKMAHMSRRILGVRVLDTGVARDVSGVLRVTENGGGWMDVGVGLRREEGEKDEGRGKEVLYKVNGDGSVRVFERGAGGEG